MEFKKVNYHGIACLELSNGNVRLLISHEFGPRILFYGFVGGQNFLKEFTEQLANPGLPEWQSFGGHRLWYAPEVSPRSYYADNIPVPYQWDGQVLTLDCPEEQGNCVKKIITIDLSDEGSRVAIRHRIYNTGMWPVDFAVWGVTVMAEGGRAIIPQEKYVPHGRNPHGEALDAARPLVLWQYTKMNDPRFIWGEKYIQMKEDAKCKSKQKIGVLSKQCWLAYALNSELFIKRHEYVPGGVYPDFGCNAEFFTMPGFLEVESLSPLKNVAPGSFHELKEVWELHKVPVSESEADIDSKLLPLVK